MSEAYRTPGSDAALRWLFAGKVWSGRAVKVVVDGPERTLISWWPGCESWRPEGMLGRAQGDFPKGSRWEQLKRLDWELVASPWTGTRVLSFFEPEKYYAMSLFWDDESGAFRFYYVNFQLPFTRSHAGFDSLDLDLDIIVAEDLSWQWKDEDDWAQARASGGLEQAVIDAVEGVRDDAVARVEAGLGDLPDWRPDQSWEPARMPENWDAIK